MINKHKLIACTIAVLMVGIDQLSKVLCVDYLRPIGEKISVIPYLFNFVYVENRGIAFGLMSNMRWLFMTVSTLLLIAAIIFCFSQKIKSKILIYAVLLIISGGIGNMIDRIFRGFVVDFIDFAFVKFYVFNIADCCVVIGCSLMILHFIIDYANEFRHKNADGDKIA